MPCNDYSQADIEAAHRVALNTYAQRLCAACKILDANKLAIPENVKEWWAKHKAIDKLREKECITKEDLIFKQEGPYVSIRHPIAGHLASTYANETKFALLTINSAFQRWKLDPINERFGQL